MLLVSGGLVFLSVFGLRQPVLEDPDGSGPLVGRFRSTKRFGVRVRACRWRLAKESEVESENGRRQRQPGCQGNARAPTTGRAHPRDTLPQAGRPPFRGYSTTARWNQIMGLKKSA